MSATRITVIVFACAAALLVAGCVQGVPAPDAPNEADDDREPGVVAVTSTGAQCTDRFSQNASTSIRSGASITTVTHERNVSVPDTSHTVGNLSFDVVNDSTSRLGVPTRSTEKPPRHCNGTAYLRYNATVHVPAEDGRWRLRIAHNGEDATVLYGDSTRSGASASVSAGESVSTGDRSASSGETDVVSDAGPTEPSQVPFDDLPGDAQDEFRAVLANGSVESDEPPALYEALDLSDDRAHIHYNGSVYEPVVANLTASEDAAYDYRVTLRNHTG
jgi:hypothetical protein